MFQSEKIFRDGNAVEPELKGPVTGPKWDPAQGEVPRPATVTEAMESSQMTHQAAKKVRCRYSHTTKGQKQLIPVVELEKAERN